LKPPYTDTLKGYRQPGHELPETGIGTTMK